MIFSAKKEQEIIEIIGNKRYGKFVKMSDPSTPEHERRELQRLMIGNLLVKWKRLIRTCNKNIIELCDQKRDVLKQLQQEQSRKPFLNRDLIQELESYIRYLNDCITEFYKKISEMGDNVLILLEAYELVATVHDLAQICNANWSNVTKELDFIKKLDIDRDKVFLNLVFGSKIEYRGKEDLIHFEDDTPFANAIHEAFMKKMETNSKFKAEADKILFECFPELERTMGTVTVDHPGNIIRSEKHYTPLKLLK